MNTFTLSATDATKLLGMEWRPNSEVKAAICWIHGMGEHIARYDHVARFLNEKGIAVVGFDHRGHGNSEGKRGHTPNYNQLLSDVEVVLGKTKELYPNVPIFMYGHSMGGNVVLNYALRKKPQVNGIIASSPWIKLAFDPPKFEVALAKFAVNIFPSLLQSTKLDATAISRDANEVQKYLKDPLVHDKISPAFFLGAYQAGLYALENAASFGLPLLIYHGSGDKLTSFAASKEFASKVKKEIVTWHEIKDAYHETHNDIGKEGILTMIADWVLSKI